MKTPKTHKLKGENIAGELCECQDCGIIQKCTMRNDFFTLGFIEYKEEEPQPLYCETCTWSQFRKYEKKLQKPIK